MDFPTVEPVLNIKTYYLSGYGGVLRNLARFASGLFLSFEGRFEIVDSAHFASLSLKSPNHTSLRDDNGELGIFDELYNALTAAAVVTRIAVAIP